MTRGLPSMTALLGLLAVVGYQNRDKLAEMFAGAKPDPGDPADPTSPPDPSLRPGGLGGMFGNLGSLLGGASAGSLLNGGIGGLLDRFKENGHGEAAESWVGPGANRELAPDQMEQAIGPDVLATLATQTGLSREELLARLTRELPQAVDRYTPDGRLPD